MKNLTSMLIILILTFVTILPSQAIASEATNQELSNNGLQVSVSEFNKLYGQPNSNDDVFLDSKPNISLSFNDISLKEDKIFIDSQLKSLYTDKKLIIEGELFNSYKQDDGIRSYVGDLKESTGEYQIVLFEINYSDEYSKTIINKDLRYSQHLKLYMKDKHNNFIIIETEIPKELQYIKLNKKESISTDKDFFWFMHVLEPQVNTKLMTTDRIIEELEVFKNNEYEIIGPTAVGSFSDWAGPTTYYVAYNVGFNYVESYSLPYGSWKALNVTNQSTWTNSFKIAEHVRVDGVTGVCQASCRESPHSSLKICQLVC